VIAGVVLAVFLGHLFPIFLRLKGGKGVATSAGVLMGLNPWLGVLTILTWVIVALSSRISSLSALVSALLAPLYAYFLLGEGLVTVAVLIVSVLLITRHRSNIANLIAGKEARIGGGS
jgi:acyl phosphate:glycerol-3-phosphate acyltransferase